MADKETLFTAHEILAELRRREQTSAGDAAGDRLRRGTPPVEPREPRASKIAKVSTGELARALKSARRSRAATRQ